MLVISKVIACNRHVDLYTYFCELTPQDDVPKVQIIAKALDVGSHGTFERFHAFV